MTGPLAAYRRSGADLPGGDPRRAHGTPLEGYYWRFTDPATQAVVVVLCGVSRDADGRHWGTVALAARFGDGTQHVADALTAEAWADPRALGVRAGGALAGDARGVAVDLGPQARLRAELHDAIGLPARSLGGVGLGHLVPGLSQYWLPHTLGARVTGSARIGGRVLDLSGSVAYAEKNWGNGFPPRWWWGQAHGFEEPGTCVAFAGGVLRAGPLRTSATALVARIGGRVLRRGEPVVNGMRADMAPGEWRLRGGGIVLHGEAPLGAGCALPVPLGTERRHVHGAEQHLAGRVELTVRRRGRLLYRGETALAGLERGGAVSSAAPWSSPAPSSTTPSPAPSPRTSAPAT